MIYQITANDLGTLLAWGFLVVILAVTLGVMAVDLVYSVFSRVFSPKSFSFEPKERDVNQLFWLVLPASALNAKPVKLARCQND